MDVVEKTLLEVSDPDSPKYQNWLSMAEVVDLVRPQQEHIDTVDEWLKSVNTKSVTKSPAEDLIRVHMSVSEAQKTFNAKFNIYSHENRPEHRIIRTMDFTVPDHVGNSLTEVSGLLLRGRPIKAKMSPRNDRRRQSTQIITPDVIHDEYNINHEASSAINKQAIVSFTVGDENGNPDPQFYSPDDLSLFETTFGVIPHKIDFTMGQNIGSQPGIEANLDVQYILGVAQGVTTWVEFEGAGSFLDWVMGQQNMLDTSPWVHSLSYGEDEDDEVENPETLQEHFQMFGVSGRSILFASGDDGVGCTENRHSFVNSPDFPAGCPFITSVGGTDGPSMAWSGKDGGSSGGGFSNLYDQPDYQSDAVQTYLTTANLPPASTFRSAGRGYPDVSAFGTDFEIVFNGNFTLVDGTSCATPTFAGIVSLLNDISFNSGGNSLGFLNPLLYKMKVDAPDTFFDIKSGNNASGQCSGFDAIEGWDPVTGLGSPNFAAMADYLKNNVLGGTNDSKASELHSDLPAGGIGGPLIPIEATAV
eukprot:Clim_evm13s2 gene=Clim_evmTU13s2